MNIYSWSEIGRMYLISLLVLGGIGIGIAVRVAYDYFIMSELSRLNDALIKRIVELSKDD